MMSNNCVSPVTCVEQDDRCMNNVEESHFMKLDAMNSNHNEIMVQLTFKIEFQKAIINKLLSEISEIKTNFQIQSQLKDNELSNLREKCEQFQSRVKEFGDNPSRIDQSNFYNHQNTLDKLNKENELLKKKNKELLNEKNSLVSKLDKEFEQCPIVSFDYGNESYNIIKKLTKSVKAEIVDTRCCDKFFDLCVTELNENLAFVGVVDGVVQKASDVIEVQQTQTTAEPTKIFEANIDNVSFTKTVSSDLEVESNHLDKTKNDIISTEENCCKITAKFTDHSDIKNILNLDQITTFKFTINDKKKKLSDNELDANFKSNPVSALQELCISQDWILPKYKFFEEGDIQPPQLTNESNKNIKHNINCLSTTRTVPIDYEVKLTGNYNSTCTEENVSIVANELTGHNELIGVQVQDQFKTVKTNKKKLTDNESDGTEDDDTPAFTLGNKKKYVQVNKDSMFEMCNVVVRHPVFLEEQDTGRLIVNFGFLNHNENHVPLVNGSVVINENQQSMFTSVGFDFAKRFQRSNNPSVRELKEKIFCVQLMINHCALTFVGFGETLLKDQEDAAYECLTRSKLVPKN
ncbi:uncharacterized protein LOC112689706 [Sipha flava]|uniref:Uncharacterized protein LOC112689706 n=2 Tax=Sipha flava TaxID=143950 RepID=A0A8B8G9N6_9HEMI|nr:uncharacterized protein LOC112689706 [Sipha flava]